MATYYIDPVSGSNANDGLSTGAAKLTVPTPTSNNTYLIKRATIYAASITVGAAVVGVTIGSYGVGAKPIINPGSSDRWSVRVNVGCTGTAITGLELTGATGNGSQSCFGVYIGSAPGSGSNSVTVRDCYIHDITSNAAGDCDGVFGFGNDIEVSGCVIENIPDDGIWIEGLRASILNNRISNVGTDASVTGDCVQLNGETASGSAGEFRVVGNYLDHSARLEKQCFIVSGAVSGSGGLVAYNTCIFPEDPTGLAGNACLYSDQPGCRFIGNVTSGGSYGIIVAIGAGQIVRSNLIVGAYYGMTTSGSPAGMLVDCNTFADCLYGGAYLASPDATSYVRNNVFYQCRRGLATHGSINKSKNSYFGNIVYNWASIAAGGSIDGDAITGDPQLSTSYRPLSTSPLIGAGAHLGYTRDADGKQRPNPPSIGAYDVATLRRKLTADPAS